MTFDAPHFQRNTAHFKRNQCPTPSGIVPHFERNAPSKDEMMETK
jgi:hypothetical protein